MSIEAGMEILAQAAGKSADTGLAVVLGVEKALGRTLVEKLAAGSSRVRAVFFERHPDTEGIPQDVETIYVDPTKVNFLMDSYKDAITVFDCFEPNYSEWNVMYPWVSSNILEASIESNTTLVFASHLVNSEGDNIRLESQILRSSSMIRTVVARIPQLYGARVLNPLWRLIYDSVLAGRKAHWIGDPNVQRSLLDVEDAAEGLIHLAKNKIAAGKSWNLASPEVITGHEFIELAFRALGKEPNVGRWGRGIVLTGGLLASSAREVLKMPYDYYSSFLLDGSDFMQTFPTFRYSAPSESVSKGIDYYGSHFKNKNP